MVKHHCLLVSRGGRGNRLLARIPFALTSVNYSIGLIRPIGDTGADTWRGEAESPNICSPLASAGGLLALVPTGLALLEDG
jgi:hypothetical protein